jgi:hypothetical protein
MTFQQLMTVSTTSNFTHVSIRETNLFLQFLLQQTLWFKELPGTNPNLENCTLATEISHFDFQKKNIKNLGVKGATQASQLSAVRA